jgi:hypothetical protein
MSRRSDPGRIERIDRETIVIKATHDGTGGRRLTRIHAGPGQRDDGNSARIDLDRGVAEALRAHAGWNPDALPEIGKLEHDTEYAAIEGRTLCRIDRVANTEHAAEVENLYGVSGLQASWEVPRIAEQRLAMAERTDDDVAALDVRHATARELECVVPRLAVQHLDSDEHALLARYFGADSNLVGEIARKRDRRDLVDDDRAHR